MSDAKPLPCPGCGNEEYEADDKLNISCTNYVPYEGGCWFGGKRTEGEAPVDAWNRLCIAAARKTLEAAGFTLTEKT